ncbi:hypothetical protein CGJ15_27250, partial [Vibrio parahaemolyticus]
LVLLSHLYLLPLDTTGYCIAPLETFWYQWPATQQGNCWTQGPITGLEVKLLGTHRRSTKILETYVICLKALDTRDNLAGTT